MKRARDESLPLPSSSSVGTTTSARPCRRRTVLGKDCGFPTHPTLVEEVEEVIEMETILLRFPCFDFFRNVHMCETTEGSARFAPEALAFVSHTLATSTPVVVLNGGSSNEMVFEGQWCDVVGDGLATTNRAVVHLCAEADAAPSSPMQETFAAAAPSSLPDSSSATSPPVASLLPHATTGVTADEERRARTEQLKGWVYDRIDVPCAVLVMQRVR